jgi:N-acetylglucosamine-6-sulfatase
MHRHGVIDNATAVRPDQVLFPQRLQEAGYQTGFFGKWHMGNSAEPQRGFHRWVSFRGQGEYRADAGTKGGRHQLNVDGRWVARQGYITDELTDLAVDWMRRVPLDQPFFLYLSHKAVHGICDPAERHRGRYEGRPLPQPASRRRHEHAPLWVQNQRNSWHGIDYPYHKADPRAWESEYRRYLECLLSVDDSLGRVVDELRNRGQLDDTLIVYTGDNGFGFGEHGLIDKRVAYEWSMRVPLIVRCPTAFAGGRTLTQMVANIDFAPTLLEAAGLAVPAGYDGRSFWPLLRGENPPWRSELLYEYYWERGFPQTPTLHALRDERYKYIRSQGVWDLDELYDLKEDPEETRNLIFDPAQAARIAAMDQRLGTLLQAGGGLVLPLQRARTRAQNLRNPAGAPPASFPPEWLRPPGQPPR